MSFFVWSYEVSHVLPWHRGVVVEVDVVAGAVGVRDGGVGALRAVGLLAQR